MADDVFSSLKFGPSPFERSLFIDTELSTGESDLLLKTQRDKRRRKNTLEGSSVSIEEHLSFSQYEQDCLFSQSR